jgi:serine/threonine protein kinase
MGPGTLVGERFELEVLAGHGGMSCVYRAHDRLTKRKVALKLSRAEDGPAR